MNKRLGAFLLGVGALLGIAVAATRGKAEAAPPLDLVQQYLAEIAAATTKAQLNAIRWRFEADFGLGKPLSYGEYMTLYNAYAQKYPLVP